MADESFKTYQEVINYLKEKKRKINLLVGNGFSMAFDPTIFSYNALSNFIKSCKDQTILKLFRIVDSTNFELIMRELDLFIKFEKEFDPNPKLEEIILSAKNKLKTSLIDAITKLHPDHVFKILDSNSKACALFLKDYLESGGAIFSTNYDLLLYWILMRESNSLKNKYGILDGFSLGNNEDLTWNSGKQNIYYLHGSLPLFSTGYSTIKEKYDHQHYLLQNIKDRIAKDQYPLFVTGGTAEEKMKVISNNRYLSFCYDNLENIRGSLIVIGFNFGEYDTHIIDAINRAATKKSLCSLFIGYYTEKDRQHFLRLCPRIQLPPEKIRIFDSKTANIWGNTPQ